MPQEKPIRIVIASILKPVDDTRMFGKIARSLSADDNYEVHVIGQQSEGLKTDSQIRLHSMPSINRLSWGRISASWRTLRVILRLKPQLLVITTHELLLAALICKLTLGCNLIYDVQENYFYNLLHTDTFPKIIKPLLAFYVRMKESLASPFISQFMLAERAYARELPFIGKKYTVIENKAERPVLSRSIPRKEIRKLLFSGTLAPSTGVFTAIEIAKALYKIDANFTLTIVGYASKQSVVNQIIALTKDAPFITIIGGNRLVPHEVIKEQILLADAGIIAYPPNRSTETAIPTKLYEYLGFQLPIILTENKPLLHICKPNDAAVVYVENQFESLFNQLQSHQFYTTTPDFVYWESEEPKLLWLFQRLLK